MRAWRPVHLLALGRHAGRVRARRRPHPRGDHRRPALPRRPQRRAAPDDAAGLPATATASASRACGSMLEKLRRKRQRRSSSSTTSAASTTTSPRSCATSSTWSARRSTSWPARPSESGDQRRQEITEEVVAERQHAARHAAARPGRQVQGAAGVRVHVAARPASGSRSCIDQLRQQLMQSYVNQMAGAMRTCRPRQMQRMKDMMADAQRDARAAASGARTRSRLRGVHGALRRLLPGEPADARRAARGDGRSAWRPCRRCSTR